MATILIFGRVVSSVPPLPASAIVFVLDHAASFGTVSAPQTLLVARCAEDPAAREHEEHRHMEDGERRLSLVDSATSTPS
jgi:hypothetical protein